MPSRMQPVVQWDVDWDDNDFTSALHKGEDIIDVTRFRKSATLTLGADLKSTSLSLFSTLTGALVLQHDDGRFNDALDGNIGYERLNRPHKFRRLLDGKIYNRGTIILQTKPNSANPLTEVRFTLHGAYHTDLVEQRSFEVEAGDVSYVAAAITKTWGIPVSVASTRKTGFISFTGRGYDAIQRLADYIGGPAVEQLDGSVKIIAFEEFLADSGSATFGYDYEADDTASTERPDRAVRNSVTYNSLGISPKEQLLPDTATPVPVIEKVRELLLGEELRAGESRLVTVTSPEPVAWGRIIVHPAAVRVSTHDDDDTLPEDTPYTRTIRIFSTVTVPVALVFYGQFRPLVELEGFKVTIADSIARYGERPINVPPWWPADPEEAYDHAIHWLLQLSQPWRIYSITFPMLQTTKSKITNLIDNAQPGKIVTLPNKVVGLIGTLTINESLHLTEMMLTLIEQREIEPPPLRDLRIIRIGPDSVDFSVDSGPVSLVFYRIRVQGTAAWGPPVRILGQGTPRFQTVSNLRWDTTYELQVATDQDFTAPLTVTFTTSPLSVLDFRFIGHRSTQFEYGFRNVLWDFSNDLMVGYNQAGQRDILEDYSLAPLDLPLRPYLRQGWRGAWTDGLTMYVLSETYIRAFDYILGTRRPELDIKLERRSTRPIHLYGFGSGAFQVGQSFDPSNRRTTAIVGYGGAHTFLFSGERDYGNIIWWSDAGIEFVGRTIILNGVITIETYRASTGDREPLEAVSLNAIDYDIGQIWNMWISEDILWVMRAGGGTPEDDVKLEAYNWNLPGLTRGEAIPERDVEPVTSDLLFLGDVTGITRVDTLMYARQQETIRAIHFASKELVPTEDIDGRDTAGRGASLSSTATHLYDLTRAPLGGTAQLDVYSITTKMKIDSLSGTLVNTRGSSAQAQKVEGTFIYFVVGDVARLEVSRALLTSLSTVTIATALGPPIGSVRGFEMTTDDYYVLIQPVSGDPFIRAFSRSDGSRNASEDYTTLGTAGIEQAQDIYLDEKYMYVSGGDGIFAFDRTTKAHTPEILPPSP